MRFRCCDMITVNCLNIDGRIDVDPMPISFCCEPIEGKPSMGFKETPRETVSSFLGMHDISLMESFTDSKSDKRLTAGCFNCPNYVEGDYNLSVPINYINLSVYPAPCQCRCIYCEVEKNVSMAVAEKAYERLFDTLEYAVQSGVISSVARWQVSTGEITIHPYHDRIMKLVSHGYATFYTNGFKYDEDIAKKLRESPDNAIDLSIDCGTADTWKKVKGVDNFNEVIKNLEKYRESCIGSNQIVLKYIILPGINDNLDDFKGLMEIIRRLDVKLLTIARDIRKKYDNYDDEELIRLIAAASYLNAYCMKNNISTDMFLYKPEERKIIIEQSKELIADGLIDG